MPRLPGGDHAERMPAEMGVTLLDAVQPMIAWGRENVDRVEAARAGYDRGVVRD